MSEEEEARRLAAHLAQRDQNDADVQEIARQIGVFCRGLDEAEVKHGPFRDNRDRSDAIQYFVMVEVGSLRSRQRNEEN